MAKTVHVMFFFAKVRPRRRGELPAATRSDADSGLRPMKMGPGKDGKLRYAPLSPDAIAILENIPRSPGCVFPLTANAVHITDFPGDQIPRRDV